ncbi:MAG: GNAT family N-acetyltransferase [Candidatus Thiodiazotropha sp. 6PLUC7]
MCWNVLPQYRNKGIGTALLLRLEQFLFAKGTQVLSHSIRTDLPSYLVAEIY